MKTKKDRQEAFHAAMLSLNRLQKMSEAEINEWCQRIFAGATLTGATLQDKILLIVKDIVYRSFDEM